MSTIYRMVRVTGNTQVGKIDPDGQVYAHDSFMGHHPVGKVDPDGRVYREEKLYGARLVGRVDSDGQVYREEKVYGARFIGKVDSDGQVYRDERTLGLTAIGTTEPPSREGGAALLLLLEDETDSAESKSFLEHAADVAISVVVHEAIRPPREKRSRRSKAPARIVRTRDNPAAIAPLQRVVGIAHASAHDVFWVMDPKVQTTVCLQEGADSPEAVTAKNEALVGQREVFRDIRAFQAVIGGGYDYIVHGLRELQMADLVIVCSGRETLTQLKIPILDENWRPGERAIDRTVFFEHAALKNYEGKTVSQILDGLPVETKTTPITKDEGFEMILKVGSETIHFEEAKALIAGYCFGEKPGRWDTSGTANSGYGNELPDVAWRKWAYRSYDCIPSAPGHDLSGVDLLVPVGLNVTQGYGTELIERLTAAGSVVGTTMKAVSAKASFWDLNREEIEPAGIPSPGSTAWAIHRAWAILMSVPGCGVTITHKILHHKWPSLFPLIDTQTLGRLREGEAWLNVFDDLTIQAVPFSELEMWFDSLRQKHEGTTALTRLRIHDILLWCLATGESEHAKELGKTTAG